MATTVTLPVKVYGRKVNGIPILGGVDAAGVPVWSLDGITWTVIESGGGGGTTYEPATPTTNGLMSAQDKAKMDSLVVGYLGFYTTPEALRAAHATGSNGEYASVGTTDTIWAWDTDTTAWKNTDSNTLNPSWDNVTGKPTLFPPTAHTHTTNEVTGLDTILAGKLTTPTGGTVNQVLKKSATGTTWGDVDGITAAERARLLPEEVPTGSISIFRANPAGVNFNDTDTVLYMNAALGDTVNHAKNNATPLPVTVSGFPVIADGIWTIPNSGDVSIAFGSNSYLTGTPEMTLDFYMEPTGFTTTSRTDASLIQDNPSASTPIYLSNYGLGVAGKYDFWEYNSHSLSPNFDNNTLVHLAVDVYTNASGVRQYTVYRDGTPIRTRETGSTRFTSVAKLFGQDGSGNVFLNLKLHYVRISKVARYKGVAFTPPGAAGYVDVPAGAWVGETIDTVAAGRLLPAGPATGSMTAFEGVPTGNGRNNDKTKLLLPLDSNFSDTAVGSVSAAVTTAGAVTIAPGTGKFGGGAARFTGAVTDQIKIGYATSLLTAQSCKISFWFKLAAEVTSALKYFFCSNDSYDISSKHLSCCLESGRLFLNTDSNVYGYADIFHTSAWNFIEFIFSGGTWYAYANGKKVASGGSTLTASNNLVFGRALYNNVPQGVFDGWLSEILIEQGGDYSAEIGATHVIPEEPATPFEVVGEWVPKTPAEVAAKVAPLLPVTDPGNYFDATDMNGTFQEIGADLVGQQPRLLPVEASAGDLAVYTANPGGINYNDAQTTLLLQKSLTNSAKSLTFAVTNKGATLDADGNIVLSSTGYMQTPDNALFSTSNGPFTIDLYLKFAAVPPPANRYILGNDDVGEGRKLNICLRPTGKIHLQYVDGMEVNAVADAFALYSYDFDGTTIRAYVNGVLMASKAWSYTAPSSWQGIGYDGVNWGHPPMEGLLGYLRYSTVARYKGVNFTPPGAAGYPVAPSGAWVSSTGDEALPGRLLPTATAAGRFAVTVGDAPPYNDSNTRVSLLCDALPLQNGAVGKGSIQDSEFLTSGATVDATTAPPYLQKSIALDGTATGGYGLKVPYSGAQFKSQPTRLEFWFLSKPQTATYRMPFSYGADLVIMYTGTSATSAYFEIGNVNNVVNTVREGWNHVVLSWDGTNLRWFLNGVRNYTGNMTIAGDFMTFGSSVQYPDRAAKINVADIRVIIGDQSAYAGDTCPVPSRTLGSAGNLTWVEATSTEVAALLPPEVPRFTVYRPLSDLELYPILYASVTDTFTETIKIDPRQVAADRLLCKVYNGTVLEAFPTTGGLGTPYDNCECRVDISALYTLGKVFNLKYGWVTAEGVESNMRCMVFPSYTGATPIPAVAPVAAAAEGADAWTILTHTPPASVDVLGGYEQQHVTIRGNCAINSPTLDEGLSMVMLEVTYQRLDDASPISATVDVPGQTFTISPTDTYVMCWYRGIHVEYVSGGRLSNEVIRFVPPRKVYP